MTRRTRHLAGFFALVATVFSLAEGTYALTCASGMEMGSASATAMEEMSAGGESMPGHQSREERDDRPDCPFGPAGAAQGCATAASLPASAEMDVAFSPEEAAMPATSDRQPHLLLASALYHPPRA